MRRLLWLVLVPLLAAPSPFRLTEPRSAVLLPEQSVPLSFDHGQHLGLGLQCQTCHAAAEASVDARDDLSPGHEVCGLCHRMEQPGAAELYPKAACSTCHAGYEGGDPSRIGAPPTYGYGGEDAPPAVVMPDPRLRFPHATHIQQGVPCLDCHSGVDESGLATRQHLPTMTTCLGCHTGGKAPSECTTCHLQGAGGRVRTEFDGATLKPTGRFRPDDHGDARWLKTHQAAARADQASCESCHSTASCLECHDGVVKNVGLHPADWIHTHGLEANRRTQDCWACHDVQEDCQHCHEQAGLRPGGFPGTRAEDGPGDKRFHPEGWAPPVGDLIGPEHHSHQARRSLETCQSCHAPDLCKECHGNQVSPHPPGWADAPERWRFGQGDGAMCLECHLPGDPNLARLNR